jgi:magnesium-transporting ATPase (P-type)
MAEAITITQASLTGEMMPIEKTVRLAAPRPGETLDLLHNDNVCLAGTSVVTGNGHALVVSTGKDTYMASIASELSKRRPENATQIGIRKVSYVLMGFMAVSRHCIEFFAFLNVTSLSRSWPRLCSLSRVLLVRTGRARSCSPSLLQSALRQKCYQ